jgi:hypothetical protein
MYNITPEEVMQMDIDSLKSKIAGMRHVVEYADILDKPPQIGCAYSIKVCNYEVGIGLLVMDSPYYMFVTTKGNSLIGALRGQTIEQYEDNCMTIRIPDGYAVDEDWIFRGALIKIDINEAKPRDVMLKLLK